MKNVTKKSGLFRIVFVDHTPEKRTMIIWKKWEKSISVFYSSLFFLSILPGYRTLMISRDKKFCSLLLKKVNKTFFREGSDQLFFRENKSQTQNRKHKIMIKERNVKMFVVNNNNEDDNPKKISEKFFFFNVSRVLFLTQPSPTQIWVKKLELKKFAYFIPLSLPLSPLSLLPLVYVVVQHTCK